MRGTGRARGGARPRCMRCPTGGKGVSSVGRRMVWAARRDRQARAHTASVGPTRRAAPCHGALPKVFGPHGRQVRTERLSNLISGLAWIGQIEQERQRDHAPNARFFAVIGVGRTEFDVEIVKDGCYVLTRRLGSFEMRLDYGPSDLAHQNVIKNLVVVGNVLRQHGFKPPVIPDEATKEWFAY